MSKNDDENQIESFPQESQIKEDVGNGEILSEFLTGTEKKGVLRAFAAYTGPLPPPSHMAAYNEIVPGAAERLLATVEKEQEHRHKMASMIVETDRLAVKTAGNMALRGDIIVIFFFLICTGAGVYIIKDAPWIATTLLGAPMLTALAYFWRSKGFSLRTKRNDTETPDKPASSPDEPE